MQLLIEELAPLYGRGRLSRINKDMRFAKEKPYKNYLATGLAGSYISFSKEGLWVGTGMCKPEPAALRRLREAIADDTSGRELTRIIASLRAERLRGRYACAAREAAARFRRHASPRRPAAHEGHLRRQVVWARGRVVGEACPVVWRRRWRNWSHFVSGRESAELKGTAV